MIIRIALLSILATFCFSEMISHTNAAEPCTPGHLETINTNNASNIVELNIASPIMGELRAISHDGTMVVTQTKTGAALWSLCTGQNLSNLEQAIVKAGGQISSAEFSPDDKQLAIIGDKLYLLATEIGEVRVLRDEFSLHDVAFSPDGRLIASAQGFDSTCPVKACETSHPHLENNVLIQSVDTGEIVAAIWRQETDYYGFSGVAFSPDGTMLATLGTQQYLFLWNVEALARREYVPLSVAWVKQQGGDVVFSPDGKQLAVSYNLIQTGGDGYARLPLDIDASIYTLTSLLRHTNPSDVISPTLELHRINYPGVSEITYISDGAIITTYEAWPGLWDAKTGENLIYFMGDDSLMVSPDGRIVITSNDKHGLRFWGVPAAEN